jgi:alpha,alpha-trehalase
VGDANGEVQVRVADYDAVVFDMDGVVTQTASVHQAAWKALFDDYLKQRAATAGDQFREFTPDDYLRYVDGKPRYDGVRDFLASRGITLPWGTEADPPEAETVCGLGNRKNALFQKELHDHGVQVFQSTVALIRELHAAGLRTAVISASKNASQVLQAGGVQDLFEAQVDGQVAEERHLPGKPDPAVFLEAARQLGAQPRRTVVVEDAVAGVKAGKAGGFGLVIGIDRGGNAERLKQNGADVVVKDLEEVKLLV